MFFEIKKLKFCFTYYYLINNSNIDNKRLISIIKRDIHEQINFHWRLPFITFKSIGN